MTSLFSRPLVRRLPAFLLLAGAVLMGLIPCHAELREHNLWWTPAAVTKGGHQVDELLMFIFWLTLFAFVLVHSVYIYFIIKYRYRKGVQAVYSHGNNRLEIIWTTIPAFIFIGLAVVSDRVWFQLRSAAPKDSVNLDIVAYQFGFHVRNPGADGKLGSYSQQWMKTGENNFGTDPTKDDPAGHDDYQSENQLTIPVGKPVNVVLRSQDVIHAFYVPEFRMYQDIVPGRKIDWVWFEPDRIGHYALACNQLCGTGHYNMQAAIDVVSQEDYNKLVAQKSKVAEEALKKKNEAPAPAPAASPAPAATSQNVPASDAPVVASASVRP